MQVNNDVVRTLGLYSFYLVGIMSRTASEDKLDSGMIIVSSDSLETK